MKTARIVACVLALASAFAQDPRKTAEAIKAHDKNNPKALNPQCKLFTSAELSKFAGTALGAPENATGGCMWSAVKGDADVMISVVPAGYHPEPKLANGFRKLPDVGARGNVRPEMGGWSASAIQGENSVSAHISGPATSEASAIALLKEALKRVSGGPA